ncbi:MAG: glycoside hydrolase family 95 protein [bacterium]
MFAMANKIQVFFANATQKLVFALALSLIVSAERGYASAPPEEGAGSSLHIWEDAPEYAPVYPEMPSDSSETHVEKKVKVKTANAKATRAPWDVWALPIGNGRLGAVFYGSVADELVQFNEDSLWSGGDKNVLVPRKEDRLNRSDNINFGSYQPFGDIHILLPHSEFTDYRRDLDISRAVGTVTYKSGGIPYRREYFASNPDQVIVIRLTADKPASITGNIQLTDRHYAKMTIAGNTVSSSGSLDEKFYLTSAMINSDIALGTPEQISSATRHFAGNNMKYEAQMRVLADEGTLTSGSNGELKIAKANSVVILLAAGTDYLADYSKQWRGEDPHARVTHQLEAAAKRPYEELLSRHIADYQSLFNRLQINLGTSDSNRTALPMNKRLGEFRKDPNDPELVALMAAYGRYLLISSSRPGSLPANLQGLWSPLRIMAAWGSDYHLNINLQMNYWQTGTGNISECDEPLMYWLQSVVPVFTRETKAMFDKPGWVAGWGHNLFGGGPIDKKVEGAWLCWHLYENYRFSGNRKLMEEVSFPIIREAVKFWENSLVEKEGVLLVPNVQSSEWGPQEDGVAYAQEIVWELFTEYVELADILGVDKDRRNKIAAMRDKLAVPGIGPHGELLEWRSDQSKLWGKEHRHISHLLGVFPGRRISPLTTPEQAKAAGVSLDHRGDGIIGFSEVHRACAWARLFNGDKAISFVESCIKGHVWPSGFTSVNQGAGTGKADKLIIDANFGIPAAIYEMLLQSQSGVLHLLPALPKKFPTGSVRGIRARDGFVVDVTWDKGELTRAMIHSAMGKPCKVRYGDKTATLNIKAGGSAVLDKNLKVVESKPD